MSAKTVGVTITIFVLAWHPSWTQSSVAITPVLDFHALSPCRVIDTRTGEPLVSNLLRTFPIASLCGVPPGTSAIAANLVVVAPTGSGYIKIWPADLSEPSTSTINFSSGVTRANNALLALAMDGSGGISAKAFLGDSGTVHLVIDVTGYMASDAVNQCSCLANGVMIFGISPSSGDAGQSVTIFGQSFATNVQVLFGDAATGSPAPILAKSSTLISAQVPPPPPGFTFATQPCDSDGDGIPDGTLELPTPISVNVRNLDGTDCLMTLNSVFLLNPASSICIGDKGSSRERSRVISAGLSNPFGTVAGSKAGSLTSQCQCPSNGMLSPVISGVSPSSGSSGAQMTISGQSFAQNVQVLFGDATSGASATITSRSSTSLTIFVPPPPPDFTFSTEPCDANGDGIPGMRSIPTPIGVSVRNLDSNRCVATLSNEFTLIPPDMSCHESKSAPRLPGSGRPM